MRTKGNYLNVKVGGTIGDGQRRAVAEIARALRGAGFTVLALDSLGRLLDEEAALREEPDLSAPVLVSVRGDVLTEHRWKLRGGRPGRGASGDGRTVDEVARDMILAARSPGAVRTARERGPAKRRAPSGRRKPGKGEGGAHGQR